MPLKKIVFVLLLFAGIKANATPFPDSCKEEIVLAVTDGIVLLQQEACQYERPSPLFEKIRQRKSKNKKVTAALLAFPFPCGIVGLHRIYLGSAPYVPIVYIATIGGGFGILPFIDFCVLLIDNEIEPYVNNEKVFMWVR